MRADYLERFVGREQTVLVEKVDSRGFASGYGEHYVPVRFKAEGIDKNTFHKVQITGMAGEGEDVYLLGELD